VKRKIPHRNRSPYGWWIASYIERAVWDNDPKPKPSTRCLAWENTVIFKAPNREAAFKKAIRRFSRPSSTFQDETTKRTGHWVFDGLTGLLPIYEKLEDGAEILWREHRNKTVAKIRSWVKVKRELETFDDTPAIGDQS
jgi:hypothetical protein